LAIFLIISLVSLLTYAVLYSTFHGVVAYKNFINRLSMLILFLVLILYLTLKLTIHDEVIISGGLFLINNFVLTIKIIVALSGLAILSLNNQFKIYEFSILILMAILGIDILISANDLIVLYLGLELFSLTSYILAAFQRNGEFSTEAGLKYFIFSERNNNRNNTNSKKGEGILN